MKKILSLLLTMVLLFSSANTVVFARGDDQIENGESITIDDPEELKDFTFMTEQEINQTTEIMEGITTLSATTSSTGLYKTQLSGTALKLYKGIEKYMGDSYNGVRLLFSESTYTKYKKFATSVSKTWYTAMEAYYRDHMDSMVWASNLDAYQVYRYGNYAVVELLYDRPSCYSDVKDSVLSTISNTVSSCTGTDRYTDLKYYHDWLCKKTTYDDYVAEGYYSESSDRFYYSHGPIGCLIKGLGVCESYSKAFKIFCMKENIPCLIVTSADHSFNYVKMTDNKWYLVDCTWDDDTTYNHKYFLVSNNPYKDVHHKVEKVLSAPTTPKSKYDVVANCKHTYVMDENKLADTSTKASGYYTQECTKCGYIKKTTTYYAKTISLSASSYTYDGSAKQPKVTVKNSKGKTISSDYYTVTYSNNITAGKATVTVKMNTYYSGTLTKTFTIKPAGTTLVSLTAASKALTINWNANTSQTTGYQICYSTSSKFKKPKYITIDNNSLTSYELLNLSSKKKYYVRIRTYKTVDDTTYYSSWSKSKSKTTLK